jgi:hypothetical protein
MNYSGVIIEESLQRNEVLKHLTIVSTKVEPITEDHKTPWLKQWTLHTVEIPEESIVAVADKISSVLDSDDTGKSSWYADFKNDSAHFIIFRDKVFQVNRSNPKEYEKVVVYGVSKGIPDYQLDFSPQIKEWERNQQ